MKKEFTEAERRLGENVLLLCRAALDNDWGKIQRAKESLSIGFDTAHDGKQAVLALMARIGIPAFPRHCKHCALPEDDHTYSGRKCLTDATHFSPCEVPLPLDCARLIAAGKFIDAIKAHRAAVGSGLAEAKDVIEAEMVYHKFRRKT